MQLTELCTSFDLSRKLKEAGVKQDSLFWYENMDVAGWLLRYYKEISESEWELQTGDADFISAFTASELWEMLQKNYKGSDLAEDIISWQKHRSTILCYGIAFCTAIDFISKPDELADFILWLIANKYMEVSK